MPYQIKTLIRQMINILLKMMPCKLKDLLSLSKLIIRASIKLSTQKPRKMRTLTSPLIGIIANSTSLENREALIQELGEPENGFFNPLKFRYKALKGEIIPLDIQPNEILQSAGFNKAKKAMLKAVEYLVKQGAEVICFTASTKRLPGKSGKEIKKLYPNQIFSIGDNATIISFKCILEHFLTALDTEKDQLACIGAGFIGEQAISMFLNHGFKNITVLSEYSNDLPLPIKLIKKIDDLPRDIKLMTACTHKYQPELTNFKDFFNPYAKIIDVSVPPMISFELYQSLHLNNQRFDAGDFFLTGIKYDFPPEILGFPGESFWYGCFSEAIMLTLAYIDGYRLKSYDFFSINEKSQNIIRAYLKKEKAEIPFINFYEKTTETRKISL